MKATFIQGFSRKILFPGGVTAKRKILSVFQKVFLIGQVTRRVIAMVDDFKNYISTIEVWQTFAVFYKSN